MLTLRFNKKHLILVFLYISNLIIQNYNLGKLVYVVNDEGVYLYSAKLLTQGFIPYKDFFLAQPAFLIYLAGFLLKILNFNMEAFRLLYTCWTFSIIFPIFFIVFKFTKSIFASTMSIILLSTFSEVVQWDMHSFALREASLPFLAFAIYFTYVKPRFRLSGLLLGFFAISLVSNLLISLAFIFFINSKRVFQWKKILKILQEKSHLIFIFILVSILGYLPIILTPHGYDNLIGYQLERPVLSFATRIEWIKMYSLKNNWPILLFGFLGSLIINKTLISFGIFNILSFSIVVFLGRSYYPHYLSILAVGLSITSGFLVKTLSKNVFLTIVISYLMLTSIFSSSYFYLKTYLIDITTPDFFKVVNILKNTAEPIFTFEPIYAIYAKKDLTFHYNMADMRYFPVTGKTLDDLSYLKILQSSKTVLIEPFASSHLNNNSLYYIYRNFRQIYSDGIYQIYVRNIQ